VGCSQVREVNGCAHGVAEQGVFHPPQALGADRAERDSAGAYPCVDVDLRGPFGELAPKAALYRAPRRHRRGEGTIEVAIVPEEGEHADLREPRDGAATHEDLGDNDLYDQIG